MTPDLADGTFSRYWIVRGHSTLPVREFPPSPYVVVVTCLSGKRSAMSSVSAHDRSLNSHYSLRGRVMGINRFQENGNLRLITGGFTSASIELAEGCKAVLLGLVRRLSCLWQIF